MNNNSDMRHIWFDEDGTPLWECNDCERLVFLWDDLCAKCQHDKDMQAIAYHYTNYY